MYVALAKDAAPDVTEGVSLSLLYEYVGRHTSLIFSSHRRRTKHEMCTRCCCWAVFSRAVSA